MTPARDFPESNFTFDPPKGEEENCDRLRVHFFRGVDGNDVIISKWELSQSEIDEVVKTCSVYVGIMGVSQPPMWLTGFSPFASDDAAAKRKESRLYVCLDSEGRMLPWTCAFTEELAEQKAIQSGDPYTGVIPLKEA